MKKDNSRHQKLQQSHQPNIMVKELFIAVLEGLLDLKREGERQRTAAVGAFLSFQAKQKNSICMRSKWSTQCKHCIERNQGCLSYHLFIIYYCRRKPESLYLHSILFSSIVFRSRLSAIIRSIVDLDFQEPAYWLPTNGASVRLEGKGFSTPIAHALHPKAKTKQTLTTSSKEKLLYVQIFNQS
jgi:hypothetical protein